jgi:WD40 repeat protein
MLRGHASGIWGLALRSDVDSSPAPAFDACARLWDTRSGECLGVLEGDTGGAWSSAVSDERGLVEPGFDGIVRLWNTHTPGIGQLHIILEGCGASPSMNMRSYLQVLELMGQS